MKLSRRKIRSISNMLATLILIAIVAFAGIMLFFMTSGFFRGGGKASLSISATGTGSSDGTRASINLVIQNTGDGVARIEKIYVAPESASATSIAGVGGLPGALVTIISGVPVASASLPSATTAVGATNDIDAKVTKTVYIQVTGSGLYAGAQLRIYVVYWDVASRTSNIIDTVVTLR